MTDNTIPRRLGPKRASKIRKLFNLSKEDDVRQYVVKRPLPPKEGKKERFKAPKIQRLITPVTLQVGNRQWYLFWIVFFLSAKSWNFMWSSFNCKTLIPVYVLWVIINPSGLMIFQKEYFYFSTVRKNILHKYSFNKLLYQIRFYILFHKNKPCLNHSYSTWPWKLRKCCTTIMRML